MGIAGFYPFQAENETMTVPTWLAEASPVFTPLALLLTKFEPAPPPAHLVSAFDRQAAGDGGASTALLLCAGGDLAQSGTTHSVDKPCCADAKSVRVRVSLRLIQVVVLDVEEDLDEMEEVVGRAVLV